VRAGSEAGDADATALEVGDGTDLRAEIPADDEGDGGEVGERGDHFEVAAGGAEGYDVVDGVGGEVDAAMEEVVGGVGAFAEGVDVDVDACIFKVVEGAG